MKLIITKGTTSKLIEIFIQDNSVVTGAGLTGLVFNSGSLTAYYIRNGGSSATAISLVTMTLGTWVSGGFKEIDATNLPGWYQLGLPDALLASGADSVALMLKGATNMAVVPIEIQLTGMNFQDTVRAGLTALPNVAAGANGGLPLGDANARVDVGKWLGTAVTAATAGIPDVNAKNINNAAAPTLTGDAYARIGANGAGLTAIGDTRMANLDTTVSSRAPSATALSNVDYTSARAGKLDNLDTTVSSRAPSATALSNVDYTSARAGKLDNLDAAVSTRSTLTAANVWQYVIEGALTAEAVMRILLSGIAGRLSGVLTNVPKFRDVANTKNRISATTTTDGRSSVTLDGS